MLRVQYKLKETVGVLKMQLQDPKEEKRKRALVMLSRSNESEPSDVRIATIQYNTKIIGLRDLMAVFTKVT